MVDLRSIAAIAVFVLVMADATSAQIGPFHFFPTDQTVDTALPTGSQRDGIVGFNGVDPDGIFIEPSDPTITFVENGSYSRELYAYNESTVTIDGGRIGSFTNVGGSNAFGSSTVNLTTGSVRRHNAFNDSKFIMSGGTLGSVNGAHDSKLVISSGTVTFSVEIRDRASATVSNASAHGLVSVGGTISMNSGSITQALTGGSDNIASIDLTDVVASGVLQASRNGTLTATGGSARNVLAAFGGNLVVDNLSLTGGVTTLGNGQITLSNTMVGGAIDVGGTNEPRGPTNAVLNMTSGSVAQSILARGNATADFFGVTLASDVTSDDTATINLNNVMGSGIVTARGRVNITGGSFTREVHALGTGVLTVASSDIEALGAAGDDSIATVTGGQVRGNIVGIDKSTITMTGASVGGGIGAQDHATIILLAGGHVLGLATGGAPEGLVATDFATVYVNGTVIENGAHADRVAQLYLNSGSIVGDLRLQRGASAHVGAGFEITEFLQAEGNSVVAIEGGRVGSFVTLDGENTELSMTAGNVDGFITASNGSSVLISGGTALGVDAFGGQTLISGGTFRESVSSLNDAVVTITGGEFALNLLGVPIRAGDTSHMFIGGGKIGTGVKAEDSSTITISGGVIEGAIVLRNDVQALDRGRVIVTGGDLRDNLEAHDRGQVLLSGGTVRENLFGDGDSVVTMTAGHVQGAAIFQGNSKFIRTGGTIDGLIIDQTQSPSLATLDSRPLGDELDASNDGGASGFAGHVVAAGAGEPTSAIFVHENATLDVIGLDLEALLVDPNYQDVFSLYQLSGTLADGTSISGEYFAVQNGSGASYKLLTVREPVTAALALVGLALIGEVRVRRSRPLLQWASFRWVLRGS